MCAEREHPGTDSNVTQGQGTAALLMSHSCLLAVLQQTTAVIPVAMSQIQTEFELHGNHLAPEVPQKSVNGFHFANS